MGLDKRIYKQIVEQERLGGIDIRKLKPGTSIIVETRNNVYHFTTTDYGGGCLLSGGKIKQPAKAHLTGSTWGGSMLKLGWIGYQMRMEFYVEGRGTYRTTPVASAKVEGDGWEYEMDWPNTVERTE